MLLIVIFAVAPLASNMSLLLNPVSTYQVSYRMSKEPYLMSCIVCQKSPILCLLFYVKRALSYVFYCMSKEPYPMSLVLCQKSPILCLLSYVKRALSYASNMSLLLNPVSTYQVSFSLFLVVFACGSSFLRVRALSSVDARSAMA